MKSLVIEEIAKATTDLSLEENVLLLGNDVAEPLYYELLDAFVSGGDRRWWWESFSKPFEYVTFKDGKAYQRITELVPNKKEPVWFVVEEDQLPFYPIYEATPEAIQAVVGECFGFEYYLIPKSKEWLLCENHHDSIYGIGRPIINKLKNIRHNQSLKADSWKSRAAG